MSALLYTVALLNGVGMVLVGWRDAKAGLAWAGAVLGIIAIGGLTR